MNQKFTTYFFVLLIAATVISLVSYHYLFNKTYVLNGSSPYEMVVNTDQDYGGTSTGTLIKEGDSLILECDIKSVHTSPYCEVAFRLRHINKHIGYDLSNFESIEFDIDYQGATGQLIRLFARNYNKAYSTEDPLSNKFNQMEFDPDYMVPGKRTPLNYFNVPSWWINQFTNRLEETGVDFSNTVAIEVGISGLDTNIVSAGNYIIKINSITFHGKWIPEDEILWFILSVWVAFGLVYISATIYMMHNDLKEVEHKKRLLKKEIEKLEEKVAIDPLTGLRNRNGIEELYQYFSEQQLQGTRITIAMADIDHFKSINDQYGHAIGDDTLVEFSKVMTQSLPESTLVMRWGGEEFLIIFEGISFSQAHQCTNQLRKNVEKHTWPKQIDVTASFGLMKYEGSPMEECIIKADNALYRAKKNGRNRVEVERRVSNH